MHNGLQVDELRPMGGWWGGLLFDNPAVWLGPCLSWFFVFQFAPVERDGQGAAPSLAVEWVPLPGAGWQAMAGRRASCHAFARPIEASLSFFDHHRYDTVELQLMRQRGRALQVVAEVDGDLDGLGIAALRTSSRLLFDGITISLAHAPADVDRARSVLDEFTDTSGMDGFPRAQGYWFTPRD